MKAIVTQGFDGLPDGETRVRTFKPDDLVTGDLARVAIGEGWAEEVDEDGDGAEAPAPAPAAKAAPAKRGKAAKPDSDGEGV